MCENTRFTTQNTTIPEEKPKWLTDQALADAAGVHRHTARKFWIDRNRLVKEVYDRLVYAYVELESEAKKPAPAA